MLSLEYYYGRRVEEVVSYPKPKQGQPVWAIVLEGGVAIFNYDANYVMPGGIDGKWLVLTTFDSNQRITSRGTTLHFANVDRSERVTVDLSPLHYAIEDSNRPDEGRVFPQRSEEDDRRLDTPKSSQEPLSDADPGDESEN